MDLLDSRQPRLRPKLIRSGQALGELSFITGMGHAITAVARTACTAWDLRREDCDHLLQRSAPLDGAVRHFTDQTRG